MSDLTYIKIIKGYFVKELKNRGLEINQENSIPLFSKIFQQINFRLEFDIISDCQIKNTQKQELYNINWNAEPSQEFARLENMADADNVAVISPGHWLTGKDLEHLIALEKDRGIEIPEDAPIFSYL